MSRNKREGRYWGWSRGKHWRCGKYDFGSSPYFKHNKATDLIKLKGISHEACWFDEVS